MQASRHDAVIIGGGFYGAAIAVYLAKQRGLKNVLLLERAAALLTRASYNNQARVHNGYHYPRSFTTAYRSRVNLPKFVREWPDAVKQDFTKIYAIARRNSKVTVKQFERFCREIGAEILAPPATLRALFQPNLIEDVFVAREYAFDATRLASWAWRELAETGVHVALESQAIDITSGGCGSLRIGVQSRRSGESVISSRYVFNCTYSGLNQLGGDFPGTTIGLKQELTEMALVRVPDVLQGLGVTVMDGPFFSVMPFPPRGLHTVSHVRYTPHLHWKDESGIDPYERLENHECQTRVGRMLRDIGRYLPVMLDARYVESLFEVKTVLEKNEGDDGRPILYEKHQELPGCYSILGGKIDNIFDVLERLDSEPLVSGEVK